MTTDEQSLNLPSRQLLIMRHAKSSWSDPGMADFDRPLNPRGQTAAPLMGQRLTANNVQMDIILASTARRVRETLHLLESTWKHGAQVIWEKQLYLAGVPTLLGHLSALDSAWSRVMLIGHNPGLSELLMHLADHSTDMPTAAVAMLEGPGLAWPRALKHRPWKQREYWTPKD